MDIYEIINKLEKKVPRVYGSNDFWKGYKEALQELHDEVEMNLPQAIESTGKFGSRIRE